MRRARRTSAVRDGDASDGASRAGGDVGTGPAYAVRPCRTTRGTQAIVLLVVPVRWRVAEGATVIPGPGGYRQNRRRQQASCARGLASTWPIGIRRATVGTTSCERQGQPPGRQPPPGRLPERLRTAPPRRPARVTPTARTPLTTLATQPPGVTRGIRAMPGSRCSSPPRGAR